MVHKIRKEIRGADEKKKRILKKMASALRSEYPGGTPEYLRYDKRFWSNVSQLRTKLSK